MNVLVARCNKQQGQATLRRQQDLEPMQVAQRLKVATDRLIVLRVRADGMLEIQLCEQGKLGKEVEVEAMAKEEAGTVPQVKILQSLERCQGTQRIGGFPRLSCPRLTQEQTGTDKCGLIYGENACSPKLWGRIDELKDGADPGRWREGQTSRLSGTYLLWPSVFAFFLRKVLVLSMQ